MAAVASLTARDPEDRLIPVPVGTPPILPSLLVASKNTTGFYVHLSEIEVLVYASGVGRQVFGFFFAQTSSRLFPFEQPFLIGKSDILPSGFGFPLASWIG